MTPPNFIYSALLLFAGLICLQVAAVVWRMRASARPARPLLMLLFALAWWDITYALFWADLPGLTPYFWLDITYLGVVTVPAAFLLVAQRFTAANPQDTLGRLVSHVSYFPRVLHLAVEPVLITLLLWTDPWHNWFFGGKRLENVNNLLDGGPVFWLNVVYSYSMLLVAVLLLARSMPYFRGMFRKQAVLLMTAAVIPFVSNLVFLAGFSPMPGADNTPFAFTISGLIFVYALQRYRFLALVPVARDLLVENMSDGVVVLDNQGWVIDANPAARRILSQENQSPVGQPAMQVFDHWKNLLEEIGDKRDAHIEAKIPGNTQESPLVYLDLRISPIYDNRRRYSGRLLVWRDITELKLAQAELERLATTDSLTQIANRRYFFDQAELELERAARYQHNLALVMIDIDNFKTVNDRFGHPAGDQVLIVFSHLCQEQLRYNDLFARFGGEEFILLLPETSATQAFSAAERIRLAVEKTPIPVGGDFVNLTISLGIACLEEKGEPLKRIISRADQRLYRAKQEGRNRTVGVEEKEEDKSSIQ